MLRRLRRLSLRVQLTGLMVLVVAAILIALGAAGSAQIERALIDQTASQLRASAGAIVREALSRPPGPPFLPDSAGRRPDEVGRAADALARELNSLETNVVVYDRDLRERARGETFGGRASWPVATPDELRAALRGAPSHRPATTGGERALLVVTPLGDPRSPLGAAAVSASLRGVDEAVVLLRVSIVVGIVVGIASALALAAPLAGLVASPIERLRRTAERISGSEPDARVGAIDGPKEIAELGESFDRMVDRLAASLARQRQFVADASHELRTPLTAIGGMVELLAMGADRGDPATQGRMLAAASREIDRLSRLVTDLLLLSRLDVDGVDVSSAKRPVDLAAIAREVGEEARWADDSAHTFLVHAPEPVVVQGDPDRLKQLALVLVDNARKYTPAGGAITIRVAAQPASLSVTDNGIGMDPGTVQRVFDRFYRADSARARADGGAGLGLAIARAIALSHGGTLVASSDGAGRGSVFRLELPAAT